LNPSAQNKSDTLSKLRDLYLFAHLSNEQLSAINSIGLFRNYNDKEIIFYEGDESNYFHLLSKGHVNIFKMTSNDEMLIMHRFSAPSLFAERATLKAMPFPATAQAIGETEVFKLQREPFLKFLREDPDLSILMISSLSDKLSALEYTINLHTAPNVMAKVIKLILNDESVFNRLKNIEIARILNITPETLSRTMAKLKKTDVIEPKSSKGFCIKNRDQLLELYRHYNDLK